MSTVSGTTAEFLPRFRLDFVKGSYTIGYAGTNASGNRDISYQDLIIDIEAEGWLFVVRITKKNIKRILKLFIFIYGKDRFRC